MKRRDFLQLGLATSAGLVSLKALEITPSHAADADKKSSGGDKKITDKDILKEGVPTTISNYCLTPDKQPNKACPNWKEKPGHCSTCMFFNKDNTLTTYKGGKYAHCQLLTEPNKPQYVSEKAWCSTYVQKT